MRGKISVILPTYNRSDFLREAVRSLREQEREVYEIIIWDDGSTDGTDQVVRELQAARPSGGRREVGGSQIRYFCSDNGGKSKALNAALNRAEGDYIWICDDDDCALPGAANSLASELDRDPNLIAVSGRYRRFFSGDEEDRAETGPGYWPDLSQGSVLRHLLEDMFLFQNATMVRSGVFEAVGSFREDLLRSMDYEMMVRIVASGPVRVLEQDLFMQRVHEGARGPAAVRHAAAQSEDVWQVSDRRIFSEMRETLPLSVYESMFKCGDGGHLRRAALLQRACVHGRHTDWANALEDFCAAAEAQPDTTLSSTEYSVCRRAMAGKHWSVDPLGEPVRAGLAKLGRSSPAGAAIVHALVRGVLWRGKDAIRCGQLDQAAAISQFVAKLSFVASRKGPRAVPVSERDELPKEIYSLAAPVRRPVHRHGTVSITT